MRLVSRFKSVPGYLLIVILIVAVCVSLIAGILYRNVYAQQECIQLPNISFDAQVPATGEYAVWFLMRGTDTPPSSIQNHYDDDWNCRQISIPSGTAEWQWVSGDSGTIVKNFNQGNNRVHLTAVEGSVDVEKVLLTIDTNCQPEADGLNCVNLPMELDVFGLLPGQLIEESALIYSEVNNIPDGVSPVVSYYLDGATEPITVRTEYPYCLQTINNTCDYWDVQSLDSGEHTLKITVTNVDTPLEKTINFFTENVTVEPNTAPSPPANLTVNSITSDSVGLAWSFATDAEGDNLEYRIEQSQNGEPFVDVAFTESDNYTITGLSNGTYNFRVIATETSTLEQLSSSPSNQVTATVAPSCQLISFIEITSGISSYLNNSYNSNAAVIDTNNNNVIEFLEITAGISKYLNGSCV